MSILIFCTGMSVCKATGEYDSRGFDAAVQRELSSEIIFPAGRKIDPAGRNVLIGEEVQARDTAK